MAVRWCCPQLRYKRRHQIEDDAGQDEGPQGLPTRPPPARLLPPGPNGLGLSPQSTAARSSLTNPLPGAAADASVHLAELVIEDSEDDSGEAELAHTIRNRSTSTLEAIKARIRRHLSQDNILGQNENEEQIARRAEVKRLMRKRIREELQSENDSIPGGSCTLQHPAPPSVASVAALGNGPRDTIEFTVDDFTRDKDLARAKPLHQSCSSGSDIRRVSGTSSRQSSTHSSNKENRRIRSHPVSLRDWIEHSLEESPSGHHSHVRQRSSLPEIPFSPHLQPVRSASLHDAASLASWRLSLSADRLADFLGPDKTRLLQKAVVTAAGSHDSFHAKQGDVTPPGRDRTTSSPLSIHTAGVSDEAIASQTSACSNHLGRRIPKSSSLVRDESPVGLWLRAQCQQFRLSEASPLQSKRQSIDETNGRVCSNTSDKASEAIALHPQLESSNSSRCSRGAAWEHTEASAALLSGAKLAQRNSKDPGGNTPMPMEAGGPLQNVVRRGFAGVRLPSFRWHHLTGHHSSGKSTVESKPDSPQKPRLGTPPSLVFSHTRHTTLDTRSENFGQPDFHNAEDHCQNSDFRNESAVSAGGKFLEVLSDNSHFAARNLVLSKLELTLPLSSEIFIEKFDGNDSDHDQLESTVTRHSMTRKSDNLDMPRFGHLKVPSIGYDKTQSNLKELRQTNDKHGSSRTRGFSSSREGDETAAMWKRALRAESVSTSARRSISAQPVVPQPSPSPTQIKCRLPRDPCPSEIRDSSGSKSLVHSPTCTELPTKNDEEAFRQSLVRSNIILEDWGRQLEEQDQDPTLKAHTYPSASRYNYKTSITPPASWAKFPSHDREQRNSTAGELDSVSPRDFAVREISTVGGVRWTTDKIEDGAPSHKGIIRSVSDRFTQPFKFRWSKLVPKRTGTSLKDKSTRGARRSSVQASGYLEYPELELLPTAGGYRELIALEREINEMKGVVDTKIRPPQDGSGALENRRSLVANMNGALQHDGSSDTDDHKPRPLVDPSKSLASSAGIFPPTTPATRTADPDCFHDKDLADSSGERYATPFTHFSQSRPLTPQSITYLPPPTGSNALSRF